MTKEYFDPRKHSAVTMRITEKVPGDFAGTFEQDVKTYYVGPQKRAGTAPASGRKVTMAPGPEYINKDGTWSARSPANKPSTQRMSMTQTMSSMPGGRVIAPVAAVHSYGDVSPVVTSDHTHEVPLDYTRRPYTAGMRETFDTASVGSGSKAWSQASDSSHRQRPQSAGSDPRHSHHHHHHAHAVSKNRRSVPDFAGQIAGKNSSVRAWEGVEEDPAYAAKTVSRKPLYYDGQKYLTAEEAYPLTHSTRVKATPTTYNVKRTTTATMARPPTLTVQDINRGDSLGKSISPCSPNARLVGGQWRHIPRHTEGDVVYTDYYGRYGKEANNYYGRGYSVNPDQHLANRVLAENLPYDRIRASIPGIETLRNKPGLTLKSTIVNGPTDYLPEPDAQLHKISETYRLRPANEREMRLEGKIP